MKTICSVNRSGKAPQPTSEGGSRIIPFNSNMPFSPMGMSTYVVFGDIYGVVWSPSQIIQHINVLGTEYPVIIGYVVMERAGNGDVKYYDLLFELTVEQISDAGMIDGQPAVSIVRRYAPVRSLAAVAGEYTYENVRFLDQNYFRQNKVVLIPNNTLPISGTDDPLWNASVDMTDPNSGALGTVTNLSPDRPASYPAMRTFVGAAKGDDMTMCRFTPSVELDKIEGGQITLTYVAQTDLNLPAAISADGSKLFFMGYYSEPRGMAEDMAPIMRYAFLSKSESGPMDYALELANVALLTVGPDPATT